jgi:putative ABC transport system ATP-binding protein
LSQRGGNRDSKKKPASKKSTRRKSKPTAPSRSGSRVIRSGDDVETRWAIEPPTRQVVELGDEQVVAIDAGPARAVEASHEPRFKLSSPVDTRRRPEQAVMVEARHVSKIYKTGAAKVVALDSVALTIGRGQMVAVMGPSGSGKTTLLNCLSGLDEISSGEVVIEGASLAGMSDAKRTKYRARRMGFVFQAFNLLPVFSAVENVELPLLLGGTRAGNARLRAIEALAAVGLGGRAGHRPAELSAGEQQRVALARAVAPDPAVLWADEPTGNLDTENAEMVIQLIKKLNVERDLTILLVTHDQHIAGWAERLLHMRDGRIVG